MNVYMKDVALKIFSYFDAGTKTSAVFLVKGKKWAYNNFEGLKILLTDGR